MSKARKQTPFYHYKEGELLDGTKEFRNFPRNRAAIRAYYSNKQIKIREAAEKIKKIEAAQEKINETK